jgi:hypothetical protein
MKIVLVGSKTHESIVNKILTEDFIANTEVANISLRSLGLRIKSVVVENGATMVYVEDSPNLLLG